MTSYLYKLDVSWPPEWQEGLPDEVLIATSRLTAPWQDEFASRDSAYRMRAFWRRLGAGAEVLRSDPVTWPARQLTAEADEADPDRKDVLAECGPHHKESDAA